MFKILKMFRNSNVLFDKITIIFIFIFKIKYEKNIVTYDF